MAGRYSEALQRQSGWRDARHRIAYLFRPEFAPELDRLGDCHVVYHADDSFSKMPGWTTELEALERRLVARADLLVTASNGMRRNLGAGAGRARVLPNGVDAEMFIRGASEPCPADIAAIPRPRIGYFGWFNPKVDFRLVQAIAAARPDWHWVLVGAVNERDIESDEASRAAWREIGRMANVHILGPRSYRELPRYEAHMDVNALCYRCDPGGWWEDASPLKLYEYLAVGRPVVGSPLESLEALRDIVAVANGPAEWSRAIEIALRAGPGPAQEAGRELARRNRWEDVGAKLDGWLLDVIAGTCASRPSRARGRG
jgi:glycosyltransferase involved in cell wall biosynthesis